MTLIKIASVDEVSPGTAKCVKVEGKELALFNINGKFYCIGNTCTHAGGPLCEGQIKENVVTCPWHGSDFDILTGKVLSPPAEKNVDTYAVTIKEKDVLIDI